MRWEVGGELLVAAASSQGKFVRCRRAVMLEASEVLNILNVFNRIFYNRRDWSCCWACEGEFQTQLFSPD